MILAATAWLATGAVIASPIAGACPMDARLVRPWAEFHRLPQRRPPYALEYRGCGRRLIYVAAVHGNDPQSATFQMVRSAFARYAPRLVIVEGFPESFGLSPGNMTDYAKRMAGSRGDAEPYLGIRLAKEGGADFVGGEPTDAEVLQAVAQSGMSAADLFGFYVLRQIEQWQREGKISGPTDPRLDGEIRTFAAEFANDVGIPPDRLAPVSAMAGWKEWYRSVNGLSFDQDYRPEDAYPSGRGSRPTNHMSDMIADVRDRHIVSVIQRGLAAYRTVLVVYGASHNVVEGPALEAALGKPKRLNLPARASGPSPPMISLVRAHTAPVRSRALDKPAPDRPPRTSLATA